jgi:hypothetical protein
MCAPFKTNKCEWARKAIDNRLQSPCYFNGADHEGKIWSRKQTTDIGNTPVINRTTQLWNEPLQGLSCKASNFRKRFRKVINGTERERERESGGNHQIMQ